MFFSDEFYADPHPIQARLRTEAPVHRVVADDGRVCWIVTRYADARAALTDPRLAKGINPSEPPISHMLNNDPPDHTRLRRPLAKAFTARRVEELRPRVEEIADDLLDAVAGRVEIDLVEDYALPLPVTVICELLGVPEEDRPDLRTWSITLARDKNDEEELAAGMAMTAYFAGLIAAKRAAPGDDLLSALVIDSVDQLDDHELMSTAVLLLTAGHETTVRLIANGTLALLRHPEQLAAVQADRSLLPGTVEELLRFDGPLTTATQRITVEPVEIGGVLIPAGDMVFVGLSSANRDPDRFPDPDELDVTRNAGGQIAFGHGIHHCIGAPLARLEGEVAFGKLLDRFPKLAPATDDLVYRPSRLFRSLAALPVILAG
jgi:cytochrome P450